MKKFLRVFMMLLVLLPFTACGNNAEEMATTYVATQNNMEMELTYYHIGDLVTKQTANNLIPYASINVTNEEEAKEIIEPIAEQYKNVVGIIHAIEYTDTEIIETLEVDYTILDFDAAKNIQGIMLDGEVGKGVSLRQSETLLFEAGFTKKD